MGFDTNEISVNSKGGTELLKMELEKRLPEGLIDDFQIICSRVRQIEDDKIKVYWLHDLPEDPETSHLKSSESRDRFHQLVFCGQWQYTRYRDYLGVPHDQNSIVIDNGVQPIEAHKKPNGEVRLVYFSTPQRGLEILVPVFEELCKKHDNIVLDVFSSYSIYGWHEADKRFEQVFERCKQHPKINYHGTQPNEVVRAALKNAHIMAYPSIWMECNSRAVIEAMSAGLLCVHPNYGGLVDTAGGMNMMYQWDNDINRHANVFAAVLSHAIDTVQAEQTQNYLQLVKTYADTRYSWDRIVPQWVGLLNNLKQRFPTPESRKMQPMFTYKIG
jgi:UDP-glucose:(glucosyl)LPS alpha-1,2-glucosyltransferase